MMICNCLTIFIVEMAPRVTPIFRTIQMMICNYLTIFIISEMAPRVTLVFFVQVFLCHVNLLTITAFFKNCVRTNTVVYSLAIFDSAVTVAHAMVLVMHMPFR